jgi:histidine ammonia-lyase
LIEISETGLGLREVVAVAREDAEVRLTEGATRAMAASAEVVDRLAQSDQPAYGFST